MCVFWCVEAEEVQVDTHIGLLTPRVESKALMFLETPLKVVLVLRCFQAIGIECQPAPRPWAPAPLQRGAGRSAHPGAGPCVLGGRVRGRAGRGDIMPCELLAFI